MAFVDVPSLPILEPRSGWHLLQGELEISPSGSTQRLTPGQPAIVPAGAPHGVRAVAASRVIVVDYPVRTSVGGVDTAAAGAA